MTNCTHCYHQIFFNERIISQSGTVIPLNEDKSFHDCQGKYTNGNNNTNNNNTNNNNNDNKNNNNNDNTNNKPKQPTNFSLYPELKQIHEQAVEMCKVYGQQFETADDNRKLMMVMHWENIISEQRNKNNTNTGGTEK